jgi:sugar phosphate isomerase/epimerase
VSGTSRPRLAFSTLACPEWRAAEVVARAAAMGWDGIEWRGGPDGTVRPDWSVARRRELRRTMGDAGLVSIAVTTYTTLIAADRALTRASIADAVAHAELAADLGASVIRVFLGQRGDDADEATVTGRAIETLAVLLERTQPLDVAVAIEPHDEHVRATTIRPILEALPGPRLGVVWDIGNAWSVGELPAESLAVYADRIAYVQVKDGTGMGSTWRLCELGRGDVPLDDALHALATSRVSDGRPAPPVSLEWERAWHEHLPPAATALPSAHRWLREHVDRPFEPARADRAPR